MPDPYLTVAEVKRRVGRTASSAVLDGYSDTDIAELVTELEETVEEYRGVAFVTRTATEVHRVPRATCELVLHQPLVQAVTSLTIDGTVISSSLYEPDADEGIIRYDSAFSPDYPATVVYTHGYTAVPARLKRATALYVQEVASLEASGTGRNLLSQNFDGGSTRYSTPDPMAGRPTGWLEVDRLLNMLPDYRIPGVG